MAGFELHFVAMGMGDCTMIKCPDGEVIIVDCGTSARDSAGIALAGMINAKAWLWNNVKNSTIHSVILTHPDKDHYNKIGAFCTGDTSKLKIDQVFFSTSFPQYTPLAMYGEKSTSNSFLNNKFSTNKFYEISINASTGSKNKIHHWDLQGLINNTCTNEYDLDQLPIEWTVHKDSNSTPAWSVKIIAGNVGKLFTNLKPEEFKNANSLIVLLEYGGKKVLLMSDAGIETQSFLAQVQLNHLGTLALITGPHHGSKHNINKTFIGKITTLNYLLISSKYLDKTHFLPGYNDAMELYANKVQSNLSQHKLYFWNTTNNLYIAVAYDQWKLDEKNNSATLKKFKNGGVLRNPLDNLGRKALFEYEDNGGLYYYRVQNTSNVIQTSMGSVSCNFDSNGIAVTSTLA